MALTDSLPSLRLPALGSSVAARFEHLRLRMLNCLPRRPRLWLASRHPDLVILPHNERAEVFLDVMGERQLISAIDLQSQERALALGAARKQPWRRTLFELPADVMLTRRLQLPAQVRDHLRQVLTYELDRLTPFNSQQVFFDARVLTSHGSKLDVELALCPREQATAWLEHLANSQLPVSTLTWAGAWPEANLLPPQARPRPKLAPLLLKWLLLLLVLSLIAAVLITPLWQRHHQQERLTQELRRVSAQAEQVSQVREALERARLGSVAVLERKREHPRMADLLLELTDLLPDDTWVQTLNYRDGEVDIRGESGQATALISLLERGPGISNVTFRSPVMQVAASGSERFHIAFKYQSRSAP